MRRRAVAAGFVIAGAAAGLLAGCTFLIKFDDVASDGGGAPPPRVDGDTPPDVPPGDDTGADEGGVIDTGVPFPPPCDTTFEAGAVDCNASYPRPECASEGVFMSYPTPRGGDLVDCNGSAHPYCIVHCPYGCHQMGMGYSDFCDGCKLRKDGTYCAKDMGAPDEGIAVDCTGGKISAIYQCGPGRCTATCTRAGGPRPGCCI